MFLAEVVVSLDGSEVFEFRSGMMRTAQTIRRMTTETTNVLPWSEDEPW